MAAIREVIVTQEAPSPAATWSGVRQLAARTWWVACLLPALVLLAVALER